MLLFTSWEASFAIAIDYKRERYLSSKSYNFYYTYKQILFSPSALKKRALKITIATFSSSATNHDVDPVMLQFPGSESKK